MAKHTERKVQEKQRSPFVIACRAWKALFQEKENKKKELAKMERKEGRGEEVKKDKADTSSIEKISD